ncbi:MAG: hypothetical protein K2X38_22310 [Gemmataceae bacterium]|nr:hypothetical protein [Gemmataceae bacterium]
MPHPALLLSLLLGAAFAGGCTRTPKISDYVAYCPKCGDETPFSASALKIPCSHCGLLGPPRLKGLKGDDRGGSVWGAYVAWGVISAVLILGSVNGWIAYRRYQQTHQSAKKSDLRCRCPGCKRKFAYPVEKAGASAMCPRCKKQFQLPAAPPEKA